MCCAANANGASANASINDKSSRKKRTSKNRYYYVQATAMIDQFGTGGVCACVCVCSISIDGRLCCLGVLLLLLNYAFFKCLPCRIYLHATTGIVICDVI